MSIIDGLILEVQLPSQLTGRRGHRAHDGLPKYRQLGQQFLATPMRRDTMRMGPTATRVFFQP